MCFGYKILPCLITAAIFAGCSKQSESVPEVRKTCDAVKAIARGIYRVESAIASDGTVPKFVSLDVKGVNAAELKKRFEELGDPNFVHLWMPGDMSWIAVIHSPSNRVSLASAMEAIAEDATCTVSLPEVFAAYVGTLSETFPAFDSKLEGEVVPEWFVTREIPKIDWLESSGVDEDIRKSVLQEIRSMQVIRRLVLEGNMKATMAKNRKEEEAAVDCWARALKRNPRESLVLERIDRLENNARGFLEAQKVLQAMKCFETLILIRPDDIAAIHNFGMCLKQIGKADFAEKVLERAEELRRLKENGN